MDLQSLRVLDVGAGSGILSFAAQLFGAVWVVGLEIDPGAALVAGQNRSLNGLFPGLVAGGVDCLAAAAWFDLALVNVLPELIENDLDALRRLLRPGSSAIFSGILTESLPAVRTCLAVAGFRQRRHRSCGEWSALRTEVGER